MVEEEKTVDVSGDATYGQQLALRLAEARLAGFDASNAGLDRKAYQCVGLATAVGSIAGLAHLTGYVEPARLPSLLTLLLVACSIRVLILATRQLWPSRSHFVGSSSSKVLYDDYIAQTPKAAANRAIAQACQAVEAAEDANAKKSASLKSVARTLIAQLIVLGLAVGWPLIFAMSCDAFGIPRQLPRRVGDAQAGGTARRPTRQQERLPPVFETESTPPIRWVSLCDRKNKRTHCPFADPTIRQGSTYERPRKTAEDPPRAHP